MSIVTVYEPRQVQTVYTDTEDGMARVDTYRAGKFTATEQIQKSEATVRIHESMKQGRFIQRTTAGR